MSLFSLAYNCAAPKPTSLANSNVNVNTTWTSFVNKWNATKTNPILIFGFDASSTMYIVLDDASIVDNTNSSVQLLANPSFETSASGPVGWTAWCSSFCNPGTGGNVTISSCRTGMCYRSGCTGGGSVDYLGQGFSAVIGRTYNITFWALRVRFATGGGSSTFYAGII